MKEETHQISIHTEFIRLQELLKFSGATETGGDAKRIIQEERVFVNGELCLQRGRKLHPGDKATIEHITLVVQKDP